jgi:DNA polymerase-3 subunit gamma/tau
MSLINKYRPQFFKDVKGQDTIVNTLIKSIKSNKLHNAYLFAGKYGTGKTTLARLLAKGINCLDFNNDLCGKCLGCDDNQNVFDIVELDAASNRGIDEIRKIKSDSGLLPINLKHKVYIIDEAHQLTSQASNAFLKTLEEPSSRTKFIFCTTEPNKLLNTIKSRCLPFYLKTIRLTHIKERLEQIVELEGYKLKDSRILFKIAEKSNNTLRDAVNYLDLCLQNVKDDKYLTLEIIDSSLNLLDDSSMFNLLDYLVAGKEAKFFNELNCLVKNGKNYADIISFLTAQVKEIIFVKRGIVAKINPYKLKIIKEKVYPISKLVTILSLLIKTNSQITGYVNPKDFSELAFLKLLLANKG